MNRPLLSIFARFPAPGEAKTRLIPAVGAEGAARIYRRLLDQTHDAACESGLAFEFRVSGDAARFTSLFDEPPIAVSQGDGDLGEKLARVSAPAIVIGSDAPGLTPAILRQAAAALQSHAAVIGPASDGGYYLLGFREPAPFAFADMTWSADGVCEETIRRFEMRGISPLRLETLDDIDTPEDLLRYPELLA